MGCGPKYFPACVTLVSSRRYIRQGLERIPVPCQPYDARVGFCLRIPNRKSKQNPKKDSSTVNLIKQVIRAEAPKLPGMLSAAGGAGYGPVGARAGKLLGGALAKKLAKMVGSGDYYINEPPLANSLLPGSRIRVDAVFAEHDCHRVTFREYVTDIRSNGTSDFDLRTVVIQPGLAASFPYLSNIATAYETYRFSGLVYEFVSMVSPYASSAMGSIMMTSTYNSTSYPPSTRASMENLNGCIAHRPDRSSMYGVECESSLQNEWFVRLGDTRTPNNLEDCGKLYVASAGMDPAQYPSGTVLGELWVSYDVLLFKHRIPLLIPGWADMFRTGVRAGGGTQTADLKVFGTGYTTAPPVFLGAAYPISVGTDGNTIKFGSQGSLGSLQPGMIVCLSAQWTLEREGLLGFRLIETNCTVLSTYGLPVDGSSPEMLNGQPNLWVKIRIDRTYASLKYEFVNNEPTDQAILGSTMRLLVNTVGSTGDYTSGTAY